MTKKDDVMEVLDVLQLGRSLLYIDSIYWLFALLALLFSLSLSLPPQLLGCVSGKDNVDK